MADRPPRLTLTNMTRRTWGLLSNPPDGSIVPQEANAACLSNPDVCMKETADRIKAKPFFERNSNWDPLPLPGITKPIAWPFLKPSPVSKDTRGQDVLALDFVPAPAAAGYQIRIYSVTYAGGRQVPPHFVAVAIPPGLDAAKPPAFLVHFKHVPGQDPTSTLFKHFNPLGFDWLYVEIWSWLYYNTAKISGATNSYDVNMPFVAGMQSSFGLCYQLAQAKKPYILVLPQVSRVFSGNKLQDYQFYSAEVMQEVLLAIQADILPPKGDTVSPVQLDTVAISANSSGCNVLMQFMAQNILNMQKNPAVDEFMRERLKEIIILDPPEKFGEETVNSLTAWRGLVSKIDPAQKKCVRFYSHTFLQGFASLAGGKNPFKKNEPGFWEDGGKATTLAYLPYLSNGKDIWQRTRDQYIHDGLKVNNFHFVHHVIPAMFLTDAARRSLFVK